MTNKGKIKKIIADNSAVVALITLFIIAVILKGTMFLNYNNIINILMNNSFIGIVALAMTLIIITENIDLSVGSQLALIGLVCITALNHTGSVLIALCAAITVGIVSGIFAGALVAKFSVPSFIVTLGTMQILRSIAQYYYNGGGLLAQANVSEKFTVISNYRLFDAVPMPIIYWLLISVVVHILMNYTAFGRHIYAVGSNEKAALLSSLNVDRIKIAVFGIAGFLVSIAAMLEASRLGSMNSSSSGKSYEMDAIAAAVIGGTAMSGGKGSVIGTIFGTLTIAIINNLMNLMGVPSFLVGAIKGLIIIVAVMLQKFMAKRS